MGQISNTIDNTDAPVPIVPSADMERIAESFAATSPNTRRAYQGGWQRWQEWASRHGERVLPADPAAVSVYLAERAESDVSPATVRMDRASIAAAHRAVGAGGPTAQEAVRQVMRSIARKNRSRGRGEIQGLDWDAAVRVARLAESDGSAAGLRDGALIRLGSDALLRASELASLDVDDLMKQPDGRWTITVRQSKTDREGRGHVRFVGAPTVAAVHRYEETASITEGALFRRINKGGAVGDRLGVRSIRRVITGRAAAAGIDGRVSGHSLRIGSAESLAVAGAGIVEMQQAGDWKSPQMPAHYVRHLLAARGAVARLRYGVRQ